jgi:hypothetical protein
MKKSRVVSNALNNPKAGYSQLARLEPTVFLERSRRLQLTALEQLSKMLEAKQESTRTQKSGHYHWQLAFVTPFLGASSSISRCSSFSSFLLE